MSSQLIRKTNGRIYPKNQKKITYQSSPGLLLARTRTHRGARKLTEFEMSGDAVTVEFERLLYLLTAMDEMFQGGKTWTEYYYKVKVCLLNLDRNGVSREDVNLILSLIGKDIPKYEVTSLKLPV